MRVSAQVRNRALGLTVIPAPLSQRCQEIRLRGTRGMMRATPVKPKQQHPLPVGVRPFRQLGANARPKLSLHRSWVR